MPVHRQMQEGQHIFDLLTAEKAHFINEHKGQALVFRQIASQRAELGRQIFVITVATSKNTYPGVILYR